MENIDQAFAEVSPLEHRSSDLKVFMKQYDQRRNKNYLDLFPQDFKKWLESVEIVEPSPDAPPKRSIFSKFMLK